MTLPIETNRLRLRRFTPHDIDDIVELASHPSVARVGNQIEASPDGAGKYVQWQTSLAPFEPNECFELGIELKEGGKIIGLVGLIRRNHAQGEIGWALNIRYRGEGYATEAARALVSYGFNELGLHRIWADTSIENTGSWKLMERLGMRREGHFRETETLDGSWTDSLVYAILSDEWRTSQ
jgi:RimJ/RimL family protein N-acetyltransferase